MVRLRTIQISFGSFALFTALIQLVVIQDETVENDVSRYIKRQSIESTRLSNWNLDHYNETKIKNSGIHRSRNKTRIKNFGVHRLRGDLKESTGARKTKLEASKYMINKETNKSLVIPDNEWPSYWNLSCPLELSMFSGAHMGGDFLVRAQKARRVAMQALTSYEGIDWKSIQNRRIYFVGDSLLRQVFISIACISWERVENYAVPWFDRRSVRNRQPNSIGNGQHSKFEEARVLLKGNTELIFHHGIGRMVELGTEYEEHDPESFIKSCFTKKPFATFAVKLPDKNNKEYLMTTLNVTRERLILRPRDFVLINGSVHGQRQFNLRNILDLLNCKKMMNHPDGSWPTFLYVMTGAQHFPTGTGDFEEKLLETDDDFDCQLVSESRHQQSEEVSMLKDHLPILGKEILDLEYISGDLHVGGRDCLHWLQPGIPDLFGANVTNVITSISKVSSKK